MDKRFLIATVAGVLLLGIVGVLVINALVKPEPPPAPPPQATPTAPLSVTDRSKAMHLNVVPGVTRTRKRLNEIESKSKDIQDFAEQEE